MASLAPSRAAYVKQEYVGAVTLLHFSRDGSLLFVGVGASLYAYETASGQLVTSYQVFSRGILHGLDYVARDHTQNWTVFFGQKRLQCVRNVPETVAAITSDLDRVGKSKVCADWIFDVQILSNEPTEESTFPTIAVGLAHNFIQLWNPNTDQLLRTVICTERCILYSLAFYGQSADDLLIASGTVFQQVLLWELDRKSDRADPQQRLHGHDGVIFKLEWSSDARMLASVSDDRTVHLWTATPDSSKAEWLSSPWTSRFRAWGHTARLWDVRFGDRQLVTTSEDGMAKVWGFDGTCLATLQGHNGKHVWRVAMHPSHGLLATGGGDGAVKLWDLAQQIKSTAPSAGADSQVVSLDAEADALTTTSKKKTASLSIRDVAIKRKTATTCARGFVAVEDGRIYELDLAERTASKLLYRVDLTAPVNVSSFALDDDECVLLIGDSSGSVAVLDIATLAVRAAWKAHASRIMKIWWHESAHKTLVTCAADGRVREWHLLESSDAVLVGDYSGPAKCATSAVAIVDVAGTRNLVCGDARANLFGFTRPLAQELIDESEAPESPSFVMRGVHGRDMIATLLVQDHLVYSGGHDGYICSFLLETTDDGVVTLQFVGRESIKGITTIKQLWLNDAHELLVFGFHATFAVLYNWTAQYRLFNIECGGWRRPHALLTDPTASIPAHTFVFTPVTKTSELVVQVHSTAASSSFVTRASLHHQYHGRTTTCVTAIGDDRLVTAGEDNALKLHKREAAEAVVGGYRWTCCSTGVAHTTTIRALRTFYAPSHKAHIVVSGGGKQRLNVWRVRDDVDVLEFLCGYERSDADQDHRILGLTTLALTENCHLIVATNSEGSVQLLRLDLTADRPSLQDLGQCTSSKKPILSCDSVTVAGRALLAVGSTDGLIHLWDLSSVVAIAADVTTAVVSAIGDLQPVYQYLAHDMGANCLTVTLAPENPLNVRIVSGGDDQNLRVRELRGDTLALVAECHARNASGSALKAVTTSHDGRFIYAAGYDQRVSQWQCHETDATLTWQCAAFTECADIADVAVMPANGRDTVVAVGQGLQTVSFATA